MATKIVMPWYTSVSLQAYCVCIHFVLKTALSISTPPQTAFTYLYHEQTVGSSLIFRFAPVSPEHGI